MVDYFAPPPTRKAMMKAWLFAGLTCAALCACDDVNGPTEATPLLSRGVSTDPGTLRQAQWSSVIPGEYVVQTQLGVDADSLAAEYNVRPGVVFGRVLKIRGGAADELIPVHPRGRQEARPVSAPRFAGFAGHLPDPILARLRRDPRVKRIEPNRYGYPATDGVTTLTSTTRWNLDRLDQPSWPLDGAYNYQGNHGQYVTVYVVDTGIRLDHEQFEGRAYFGADLWDGVRPPSGSEDCTGHGTAMASLIGGKELGVARAASLVSVRIMGCATPEAKMGRTTYAAALAGLRWVLEDKRTYLPNAGAVANLSWNFPVGGDSAAADSLEMLESVVTDLLNAGVTVVASAGNSGVNACDSGPGRLSQGNDVVTVAAILRSDTRLLESNHGDCVSMSAPGDTMTVALAFYSAEYDQIVGKTSAAAAHVSGTAALYLSLHPASSPAQVKTALLHYAHRDVLIDALTPSKLLVSTRFIDSVAVTADPTRLGSSLLGIHESVAVRCHGYHASGTELDQVRCRWRSSDTTIAVVSSLGVVTGRAPGTVRIHGQSGPGQDSVTLTVPQPFRAEPVPLRARMNAYLYNQMGGPGGTTTLVEWWTGDGGYGTGQSWPYRYRTSGVYLVRMCIHGFAGVECHSQSVAVYP